MIQIEIFISPSSLFCLMKSLIDGNFVWLFFFKHFWSFNKRTFRGRPILLILSLTRAQIGTISVSSIVIAN